MKLLRFSHKKITVKLEDIKTIGRSSHLNLFKLPCYKKLRIFDKKNRKKKWQKSYEKNDRTGKKWKKIKKKMNNGQPEIFQFIFVALLDKNLGLQSPLSDNWILSSVLNGITWVQNTVSRPWPWTWPMIINFLIAMHSKLNLSSNKQASLWAIWFVSEISTITLVPFHFWSQSKGTLTW